MVASRNVAAAAAIDTTRSLVLATTRATAMMTEAKSARRLVNREGAATKVAIRDRDSAGNHMTDRKIGSLKEEMKEIAEGDTEATETVCSQEVAAETEVVAHHMRAALALGMTTQTLKLRSRSWRL